MNSECIYRKTVDYMSRMALAKDDFRRSSLFWEFRVTGNWVKVHVAYQGWKWAFKKRLEFSRNKEKHATTSLVSRVHYTSFSLFSLGQIIFSTH